MHDFDDNGKLDGIELRIASEHSMEHMATEQVPPHMRDEQMERKTFYFFLHFFFLNTFQKS